MFFMVRCSAKDICDQFRDAAQSFVPAGFCRLSTNSSFPQSIEHRRAATYSQSIKRAAE